MLSLIPASKHHISLFVSASCPCGFFLLKGVRTGDRGHSQIAHQLIPHRCRMDGFHDQQVPYCNSKVSEPDDLMPSTSTQTKEQTLSLPTSFDRFSCSSSLILCVGSDLTLLPRLPLPQGPFKFHLIIKDKQLNKLPSALLSVKGYALCYSLLIMSDTFPLHGSGFRSV